MEKQPPASLFHRYMDDILRTVKKDEVPGLLIKVNSLHPNLQFTAEETQDGVIPFLDMEIRVSGDRLESTWYTKPTDTGTCLSFHACAPMRYKRNTIEGSVHRILHACFSWQHFHTSLEKAKKIWEQNSYPPSFYNNIIRSVLDKQFTNISNATNEFASKNGNKPPLLLYLQYRGNVSDRMLKKVRGIKPEIKVTFLTTKLRDLISSLKPPIPKELKSRVVYKIECSSCKACYVGQTSRHFCTRLSEHLKDGAPVADHLKQCDSFSSYEYSFMAATFKRSKLMTLEALYIEREKPEINSKEEYKRRPLAVKLWCIVANQFVSTRSYAWFLWCFLDSICIFVLF